MTERRYTSQNLAGILAEALGLEAGGGRTDFSGNDREVLRRALDHASHPQTFGELLRVLEATKAPAVTLAAVRRRAAEHGELSLQDFALQYAKGGRPPRG